MMETSTSTNKLNYQPQPQEKQVAETTVEFDNMFYEHIKPQLDQLTKDPSEDTIAKILAYAKSR